MNENTGNKAAADAGTLSPPLTEGLYIRKYPHPILRERCTEIAEIDDDVRRLADAMLVNMYAVNGVGLAAPQVGVCRRLLVADISKTHNEPVQIANPRIVYRQGGSAVAEGCLSIPGVTAEVARSQTVVVEGLAMDGSELIVEADELLAICLQHEIDHLDGVLFIDHLSRLKRQRLLAKYQKLQEG